MRIIIIENIDGIKGLEKMLRKSSKKIIKRARLRECYKKV